MLTSPRLQLKDRLADLQRWEQHHQKNRDSCTRGNSFIDAADRDGTYNKRYSTQIGGDVVEWQTTEKDSDGDGPPLTTAMVKREKGRVAVGASLKHFFKKLAQLEQSARVVSEDDQASRYILSVGKELLNGYEHELREEQTLLDDLAKRRNRACTRSEKQQLASWEADVAFQQDLWSRALKLVLKAQIEEHASRASKNAPILARIMQPSFPPELFILVVEFLVESQLPRCTIMTAHTPDTVVNEIFATAQSTDRSVRDLLRQTAANALVKVSSIRIPATFTLSHSLTISPLLAGHEQHLRHLELDLRTRIFNDWPHIQLNRSIDSMASMASVLTSLETCVILCHFQHHGTTESMTWPFQLANTAMLDIRNLKTAQSQNRHTIGDTLLELIKAFLEHGPGKRKFIRFSHASRSGVKLVHGPLVPVSDTDGLETVGTEMGAEDSGKDEAPVTSGPQRVLDRAYWGTLTLARDVIRPDRAEVVTLQDDGTLNFEMVHS